MIEKQYNSGDIMAIAISGDGFDAARTLATYANPDNWTQIIAGDPPRNYWAWKGHPVIVGCELALLSLANPKREIAKNKTARELRLEFALRKLINAARNSRNQRNFRSDEAIRSRMELAVAEDDAEDALAAARERVGAADG